MKHVWLIVILLFISMRSNADGLCNYESENVGATAFYKIVTLNNLRDIGFENCLYEKELSDAVIEQMWIEKFCGYIIGIMFMLWVAVETLKVTKKIFLIIAIILSYSSAGHANDGVGQDELFSLVGRVATVLNVDVRIANRWVMAESGRYINGKKYIWPWTLNIDGKGVYYNTREEAEIALTAAIRGGAKNIDIGLLQISHRWNGGLVKTPLELLDPNINAAAGIHVFKGCGRKFSALSEKFSCYNSGDLDEKGLAYASKILERNVGGGRVNGSFKRVRYVVGTTS